MYIFDRSNRGDQSDVGINCFRSAGADDSGVILCAGVC